MFKLESCAPSVSDQDVFAEGIQLHIEGNTKIQTTCGGFCSLVDKLNYIVLFLVCMITIGSYAEYDVSQSHIFYDINTEIDLSEDSKDLAFEFKWNATHVDMIDNEFVYARLIHQTKIGSDKTTWITEDFGLPKCKGKSHLSNTTHKRYKNEKFLYCLPSLKKEHIL